MDSPDEPGESFFHVEKENKVVCLNAQGRAGLSGRHTPIFFRERKRVRPKESLTVSKEHTPVIAEQRGAGAAVFLVSYTLLYCSTPCIFPSSARVQSKSSGLAEEEGVFANEPSAECDMGAGRIHLLRDDG